MLPALFRHLDHFRLSFIRSPIARQSFTSSDERTRTLRISTADIGSGCHPRLRGPWFNRLYGSAMTGNNCFFWGSRFSCVQPNEGREIVGTVVGSGGVEVFIGSGGGRTGFVLGRWLALFFYGVRRSSDRSVQRRQTHPAPQCRHPSRVQPIARRFPKRLFSRIGVFLGHRTI